MLLAGNERNAHKNNRKNGVFFGEITHGDRAVAE